MKELFHPVLHFSPLVFTVALLEALFWCTCTISPTPLPPRANGELLLKKQTENLKAFSVGNQRLLEEKMSELSETKGTSEVKLRHQQSQERQFLTRALEQNHADYVAEEPADSLSPLSLIVLTPIHEEDDPNSQKFQPLPKESAPQSILKTRTDSSLSLPCVLTAIMLIMTSVFMSKGKEGKRGTGFSQHHFAYLTVAALVLFSSSCVSASQLETSCGLNCWLQNLTITLPPVEIHQSGLTATLSNGVCNSINVETLDSSILSPSGLHVALNGIAVSCVMDYHFKVVGIPGSGTAYASVSKSSWALDMQLQKGSDGLADSASVTLCDAKIATPSIHFSSTLSGWVLNIFKGEIERQIQKEVPKPLCQEISTLVATNLTAVLQEFDGKIRPYMHPRPEPVLPVLPTDAISFRDNTVVALVDYLFNDLVGVNGTLGLNKLAKYLTKNTGSFSINNLKLNYTVPIPKTADLQIGLIGFNISGLDTWKTFQLLVPSSDYALTSFTDLKTLNFSIEFFVNVSLTNGSVRGRSLYERALLVADLSNNQLNSTILLGLNGTALNSFVLNQLLSPNCLLTAIEALNFTYLNFNFTVEQLALKALGGDTEKQLDDLIDNLLELLTQTFKLAAPAFFNSFISTPAQNFLNTEANQLIKNYAHFVPPSSDLDEPTYNKLGLIVPLIVAVIVFLFVAVFIASRMRHRKNSTLQESLLDRVRKSQPTLCDGLVFSPKISNFFRYLVPFLLFVNVALFISSNTGVGASVYLVLVFGQKQIQLPALFQFTLDNSVKDMWSAGVYPLSLLIASLSGAWPYLKILLMIFCWFSPVRFLSPKRREQVLMALDVLGKWGMIDAFVLTLMLVAFHFNIAAPVPPESLASHTYMFAYVGPHWGIHGFILAAIVSLALTHIILHLHRISTQKPENMKILEEDRTRSSLFTHAFKFHSSLQSIRIILCLLIPLLICLSIGLLIVGAYIESFYFEFKGALGLVLNFLEGTSERHYSLLSLAYQLPGAFPDPSDFGVRLIQATLVAFAFAVPLVFLVSLLGLWLIPLTFKEQKRLFIWTEILQAWSSLEVFIIAVIAALVELQQFAQFIIGNRCDAINKIMEDYLIEVVDEPKCFDVDAHLTKGCWLLFGSCVLYAVVGLVVTRTCHKALEEREEQFNLTNTEDPPEPPSPIISDGDDRLDMDRHAIN